MFGPAKQWILGLAAVGILFFPFSAGSVSEKTTQDKQVQALRNLENKWLTNENDPDVLETILANDFVHVLPFGFISKDDQIGYLRKHKVADTGASRHFEDLRIRIYGKTGIVNGIVVAEDKAGGALHKTLFTDVFVFRDSRWQAVNGQELAFAPSRPQSHP
jgi:hypothetical protein